MGPLQPRWTIKSDVSTRPRLRRQVVIKLRRIFKLTRCLPAQSKQSIRSQPIPEPVKGHVQVRVEAAAFNPVDYKVLLSQIYDNYPHPFVQKFPTVLGWDAAGKVTKIGPDVTNFKVGDRVAFLCMPVFDGGKTHGERGAFQQYALADIRLAAKIPGTADYDSASSFPVGGNTAAAALYSQLKFTAPWLAGEGAYKGEKIVILGGSSSVGSYAIQLAALSGFEVITTSSPAHFDYLKSLGASAVIDRSATDVAAQILAAADGPVKYVVDSISLPPTQLFGVEILQPKGSLVLVTRIQPPTKEAADAKEITLLGTVGSAGLYFSEPFWNSIKGLVERGVLKFNRPTVLPGGLRAWEEGFELHRQGKVSGTKLVIRPQETK
ncbi:chaperonin 10-like protein [Mycena maculata]|uniref:Chaperonin 10-like protein n=1 Tax=Mycena maculata TaxID=230809 RepID=A0AAD7N3L1_9AGAR|nr:chaperonin 10-like protein [Mycena maculata]